MKHGSLIKVIKKFYVGNTTVFTRFHPPCSRHWIHGLNVPAVSDRCLQKLNQLLWVSGVGPRRRHHLAWPQEGHLQGHGMVVEDKHLVLLLP